MNDTCEEVPSIEDVRAFWDANPLWTGEGLAEPGSKAFFEEHRRACRVDCFAGAIDERIFPRCDKNAKILDLGCGIGFWLVEFSERGYRGLSGADLSAQSLDLARQRCSAYGIDADLSVRNAEKTGFPEESFDHVNCQGVIHHTPHPEAAVEEIASILRPGGTASISVYYRNIVLRQWRVFQPLSNLVARMGAGLKGRGREGIYAMPDVDAIVRTYDGVDNPIGKAYDRSQFRQLIGDAFEIEDIYFHFFPARSLPLGIPGSMHRVLDRHLPFMIYANLRKLEARR